MNYKTVVMAGSLLVALSLLQAESFDEYKAAQDRGLFEDHKAFERYTEEQQKAFRTYIRDLEHAFELYRESLKRYWKDPKLSTQKEWVSYLPDKKTRFTVDFENDTLVVETVSSSKGNAIRQLKKAVATAVVTDTQTAPKHDDLLKRINVLSEQYDQKNVAKHQEKEPILTPVLFSAPPSVKEVKQLVEKAVSSEQITTVDAAKEPTRRHYVLKIPLPDDMKPKRAKLYEQSIRRQAKRFNLPPALVFAVMHTESAFNPYARSPIPAFGLMQIVPRSAGIDANRLLYHRGYPPSAKYLYDGVNNTEMGSAYLYLLYYRYLKRVKDPKSRLYCTIAAYNTGAGNVARAFVGTTNIQAASIKINEMKSEEVYRHLEKHLPYAETRNYLKKVRKRYAVYKKIYG